MKKLFVARRMTGRCSNGAERDGGTRRHAVPCESSNSWERAACGARPGSRGNGWSIVEDVGLVTCPRCRERLERLQGEEAEAS